MNDTLCMVIMSESYINNQDVKYYVLYIFVEAKLSVIHNNCYVAIKPIFEFMQQI